MPSGLSPSDLFTPRLCVLYAWVASALYVHFRGRERLPLQRALLGHTVFTAPYDAFVALFTAVPRTPRQRLEDFPELAPLQEHWQVIRDEALAVARAGEVKASDGYEDLGFNSFFRTGWTRFYLRWYGDPLPSARERCPRTVALLEQMPSVNAAVFTRLAPRSGLVRHRDPFAGSLRYHLGLATPDDDACRILIDGEPYSWRDGEAILWDETYLHKAMNDTDEERLILFCDVTRPLRGAVPRAINRFLIRHVVGASASRNQAGEPLGVLNRLFGPAYALRRAGKALKRRSRAGYYALKTVLVAGLLYWVFVS